MSKNNKNKLVPRLRFPEFVDSGEWEVKLISDYFTVGSSKRVLQEDWTNKGVPFYRTRELVSLSKNESFGSKVYISEELFMELKERYGTPTEGDFLVSGVGTLGICYQVQAKDKFYFKDGNVLWFKLEKGLNSTYFKYCFQSDHIQNQIIGQASKSTVGTYTIQNANNTKFWYPPNINEQQKIAACLSSLDDLITAESQKLEVLKEHKKGLLQNLFPQEGETVPKMRFKEFEDCGEWEVIKFNEACKFIRGPFGGALKKEIFISEGYAVYEQAHAIYGDFSSFRYFISEEKYNELKRFSILPNDIIMSCSGTMGKFAIVPKNSKEGVINQALLKLTVKTGYEVKFIKTTLELPVNQNKLLSQSAGGAIKNVVEVAQIKEIPLLIPSLPEQQKIAACLSSLDDLINAQRQKIELLQLHKKGLLQGLFPQINDGYDG